MVTGMLLCRSSLMTDHPRFPTINVITVTVKGIQGFFQLALLANSFTTEQWSDQFYYIRHKFNMKGL